MRLPGGDARSARFFLKFQFLQSKNGQILWGWENYFDRTNISLFLFWIPTLLGLVKPCGYSYN